ncbi:proton-translocating transhydrogenase family protein [Sphingobium sp. Sx8-8]|uniref:proton-translocating transhydrogenase family protein n=1 Tax=Sphingobium sp. Sx8-8 TaxID=2933617 RepID=UPI001F5A521E|nr:proton-translocating transhydrogenase family protein [Sphingobium sp. Sx8-8]
MTLFLLISFLAACAFGLVIGWRARPNEGWALVAVAQILCSAVMIGGLIVAAEAGSMSARMLGLAAVLLGSASLCGGLAAARRLDRP